MTGLLDPAFTRELEALRRRLAIRARSGESGERVASRRGGSAEFLEHRPYAPGDDLRRVDWLAFARTGEPVLKLFRAEEDAVVRVLVDASASLDFGEPTKLTIAKKLAAAIGYMALASSERAQVIIGGQGLTCVHEPLRGRGSLPRMLRELDVSSCAPGTDLASAIDGAVQRAARPGMLVVLSDFFDSGPVSGSLARAAAAGHDIGLVHVLSPEDIDPPWDGDLALEDAETQETLDVTLDDQAREAYLRRLQALQDSLRESARKLRGPYVVAKTNRPLLEPLRSLVSRTVE